MTGWERFALEYTSALDRTSAEWCTVVPLEGGHRPGGRVPTHVRQLIRYAYGARRHAEAARVDVLHALTFPPGDTKRPTVWTVHDDLVLGGHPQYARAGARIWVPLARRALRWTDRVVTGTQTVAEELAAVGVSSEKLRVVTPGVPDLGQPVRPTSPPVRLADGRRTALPEEFLLTVGTIEERKRPALAAAAAERVGASIIFVGRIDPGYEGHSWPAEALRLEGVTDAELSWLYQHASALLALSRYEGLDFPVLEALSLGTPVVASDIPVHREFVPHTSLVPPEAGAVADAVRGASVSASMDLPTWWECAASYQSVYAELI